MSSFLTIGVSSVCVSITNSSSSQELHSVSTHGFSNTSTASISGTNMELTKFNVLSTQPPFQQLNPSEQEELKEMLDEDVRKMKHLFGSLLSHTNT